MKTEKAPVNKVVTYSSWPRNKVKTIETRKRDLVFRVTDWTRDKDEPAYDVEVYNKGVYDWNESQTFTTRNGGKTVAKQRAIAFVQSKVAELL